VIEVATGSRRLIGSRNGWGRALRVVQVIELDRDE